MTPARSHGLLIGLGAAALALLLWFTHALDGWENTTWAWRVRTLAAPAPTTDRIVLILLDQPSLDWGERENGLPWPWPREVYVPLLDFCTRAGAAAVAFDVLFTEPSTYGVADDAALGEAIARNGVFVGARFLGGDPRDRTPATAVEPIAEVAAAARLLANVGDVPDADGIFRRANLARTLPQEVVPSLGVGAWLVGHGRGTAALDSLLAGVPRDRGGSALLRFRGPTAAFTTYSAAAVIQSELRLQEGGSPPIEPEALRGKYVLFGFSAPGLLDLRPTPVSRVSPGVVIHATVLDDLLAGDFLRPAPAPATMAGILALGLLAGWLAVAVRGGLPTILLAAGVLAVPPALGFLAYGPGWWWPVVPGVLAAAVALFGGAVRNYAVEGRQKRFIKQAFRHYLSPEVIENILADPGSLKLGGERRELTIMFSDLAGFTALSEGLAPEDLTALLNDYLTDMTDIILAEGGTLDKYEGDAIIAFWNAPADQPDHAVRACTAAVRCQGRLAERRAEFRARCGRDLHARIGLHTGPVIVGNMGSRQRFDYTVLGDAANLASRLEGANKAFASEVMISGATRAAAGDRFLCRALGPVLVVGRSEPVEVFELAGTETDPVPDSWAAFAAALALWRAGDAAGARERFAALRDDPVALGCARMCGGDRPGVWVLEGK